MTRDEAIAVMLLCVGLLFWLALPRASTWGRRF